MCVLPDISQQDSLRFFLCSFKVGKVLFCILCATYHRVLLALSRIEKKKKITESFQKNEVRPMSLMWQWLSEEFPV